MQEKLTRTERENYLIKLKKEFVYAGTVIPERITVEEKEVRLRAYVFDLLKKKGALTGEEQEKVDRTAALARKKRKEIVGRLEREDLDKQEAEELFNEAAGITRALDTLHTIHEPKSTVKAECNKAKIEDGRRWINLVKKIYAKEDIRPRERS